MKNVRSEEYLFLAAKIYFYLRLELQTAKDRTWNIKFAS